MSENMRNKMCHCGSLKKYKHCCLKIERNIEMEERKQKTKLSNDFRDNLAAKEKLEDPIKAETELVGEDEMLRRDSICTLRQMQVQKAVMEMDYVNLGRAFTAYELLLNEVKDTPICEARTGLMELLPKTLDKLEQQSKQHEWRGVNAILLNAMENMLMDKYPDVKDGTDVSGNEIDSAADEQIEESLGETTTDKEDESMDDEPDNQDEAI